MCQSSRQTLYIHSLPEFLDFGQLLGLDHSSGKQHTLGFCLLKLPLRKFLCVPQSRNRQPNGFSGGLSAVGPAKRFLENLLILTCSWPAALHHPRSKNGPFRCSIMEFFCDQMRRWMSNSTKQTKQRGEHQELYSISGHVNNQPFAVSSFFFLVCVFFLVFSSRHLEEMHESMSLSHRQARSLSGMVPEAMCLAASPSVPGTHPESRRVCVCVCFVKVARPKMASVSFEPSRRAL